MDIFDLHELEKLDNVRLGNLISAAGRIIAQRSMETEDHEMEHVQVPAMSESSAGKRIKMIRAVREITGNGLRDSMRIVESGLALTLDKKTACRLKEEIAHIMEGK